LEEEEKRHSKMLNTNMGAAPAKAKPRLKVDFKTTTKNSYSSGHA
jgi:hypothetical protein